MKMPHSAGVEDVRRDTRLLVSEKISKKLISSCFLKISIVISGRKIMKWFMYHYKYFRSKLTLVLCGESVGQALIIFESSVTSQELCTNTELGFLQTRGGAWSG
jgi:hypothetical protein